MASTLVPDAQLWSKQPVRPSPEQLIKSIAPWWNFFFFFLQARIDLSSWWFVRWQGNTKHHHNSGHVEKENKKEKEKKNPPPSLSRRRKDWSSWGHFIWFIGNKVDLINILIKRISCTGLQVAARSRCTSILWKSGISWRCPAWFVGLGPNSPKKPNWLPPARGSRQARC